MGFKFKHIFKGPTKIFREVGRSGILGRRGDHYRVLGIKLGKDLVPIFVAGQVVAATIIAGPAGTVATITTAAVASGTATALNGGNESDVTKAIIIGGASAGINISTVSITSVPKQMIVNGAANACVAKICGIDPIQAGIMAAFSSPGIPSVLNMNIPTPVITVVVKTTGGAIVASIRGEKVINAALRQAAVSTTQQLIYDVISTNSSHQASKIDNNDLEKVTPKNNELKNVTFKDIENNGESVVFLEKQQFDTDIGFFTKIFKDDLILTPDIKYPEEQRDGKIHPGIVQKNGSICSYSEMLKATAFEGTTNAYPIAILLHPLTDVRLECDVNNVSHLVGHSPPKPLPLWLEELGNISKEFNKAYIEQRFGH